MVLYRFYQKEALNSLFKKCHPRNGRGVLFVCKCCGAGMVLYSVVADLVMIRGYIEGLLVLLLITKVHFR